MTTFLTNSLPRTTASDISRSLAYLDKESGSPGAVESPAEICASISPHGVIHRNGSRGAKPFGTREFTILDSEGNFLSFQQPA
jgi:hypothetical protein